MDDDVSCELLEVVSAGTIRLTANGAEHEVKLRGVSLPPHARDSINAMFERLRRAHAPVRCKFQEAGTPGAPTGAQVRYLAWRDKSGDVWLDLAATLLEERLARPA
jgi:hypothetical protein